jgi:hypothetical protein
MKIARAQERERPIEMKHFIVKLVSEPKVPHADQISDRHLSVEIPRFINRSYRLVKHQERIGLIHEAINGRET